MRDRTDPDSLTYQKTDGKAGAITTAIKSLSAMISLGLIIGIVVWSWRLGARDPMELPVIKAMEGPSRIQPADPGGTQAENQGLEVNGVLANNTEPPVSDEVALAPQPASLTEEDAPQGVLNAGEAPASATSENDSVASLISGLDENATIGMVATAPPAEAQPVLPPTDLSALRPQPRPENLNTQIASVAPTDEVFSEVEPEAVAETASSGPAVNPGDYLIQLGAFDTQEIAETQWQQVLESNGDLLGGKEHLIQETTSGGRVFYRLRVVGFAGKDESRALCSALQPREVPCIPVTAR